MFLRHPMAHLLRWHTSNIKRKGNAKCSQSLGMGREARIQTQLSAVGIPPPFVESTVMQTCYARSLLLECKKPCIDFKKVVLYRRVCDSAVPPCNHDCWSAVPEPCDQKHIGSARTVGLSSWMVTPSSFHPSVFIPIVLHSPHPACFLSIILTV